MHAVGDRGAQAAQLGPGGRILRQASGDYLLEPRWNSVQAGLTVDDPVQHGGRGARPERGRPGGRVTDHAAEREHVALGPGGLAFGLFG